MNHPIFAALQSMVDKAETMLRSTPAENTEARAQLAMTLDIANAQLARLDAAETERMMLETRRENARCEDATGEARLMRAFKNKC